MKKTSVIIAALAALLLFLCCGMTLAGAEPLWSGSGTESDPYRINSAADFVAMGDYISSNDNPRDSVFKLYADIDLSGYCGLLKGSWKPISAEGFDGILDGNGHTVSGLYILRINGEEQGLFGRLSTNSGGTIRNLTVEGSIICNNKSGGIAGVSDLKFVNCSFNGSVSGTDMIGGVVGYSSGGVLENCRFSGSVTGSGSQIGGITGVNDWGILRGCTLQNESSVTGHEMAGGITGSCVGKLIENCFSHGTVTGDKYIGGIVGISIGPVRECVNYGSVTGVHWIGGVAGYTYSNADMAATVENCKNYGMVNANGDSEYCGQLVGGIVGVALEPISQCENYGFVQGEYYVGGIVGHLESRVVFCKNRVMINGSLASSSIAGNVLGGRTTMTLVSNDDSNLVLYSIDTKVPACPFTCDDGQFFGWNTEADGSGTYYYEGDNVFGNDPMFLYAIWMNGTADTSCRALNGDEMNVQATVLRDGTYNLPGGWYTATDNITMSERLTFSGDANLVLAKGVTLNAAKGIHVPAGSSLTIWSQGQGNYGELNATGAADCAGIGGNKKECPGIITINGGTVNATGGDYGAGIGGGDTGRGGTVIINAGTVTAKGKNGAAGIGGGDYASGGSVTINGGRVSASGSKRSTTGQGSAGIGAGRPHQDGDSLSGGSFVINGGYVYSLAGSFDETVGANAIGANFQYSEPGSLSIADGICAGRPPANGIQLPRDERAVVCREGQVELRVCESHEFHGLHCMYCNSLFPVGDCFAGAGTQEDPYLIQSADDWNMLAGLYSDGILNTPYQYRLTADIAVNTMLGTDSCPFNGDFDGAGHTLTFNYANTDNSQRVAPFAYISGSAICNLRTEGKITGNADRCSGLVGECVHRPDYAVTHVTQVTNCRVSMSLSGGSCVGGFCISNSIGLDFKGCVFDGKITAREWSGGFVGLANSYVQFTDCLFVPVSASGDSTCRPFCCESRANIATFTNSYWYTVLGTAQGTQAFSVTADPEVTIENHMGSSAYMTSELRTSGTLLFLEGVYYIAQNGTIRMGLSADPWEGYTQTFTAGAGTLTEANYVWTLTMPDKDVVISVLRTPDFATAPTVHLTADGGTDGYRDQDPDKLFDNKDNTKWCCAFDGSNWAEFHADFPVIPTAYAMTTAGDAADYLRRNPVSWRLLGRRNLEDSWTALATVTDNDYLPAKNCVEIFFPLTVSGSYQYYRLEVTAVQAQNQLQIAEFRLAGMPVFGTAAFTLPVDLATIGESAFEGMTAMTIVDAGHVTSIGPNAFKGCTGLTEIRLPAGCAVDESAFTGCGTVYVFAPAGSTTEASCATIANCVFMPTE